MRFGRFHFSGRERGLVFGGRCVSIAVKPVALLSSILFCDSNRLTYIIAHFLLRLCASNDFTHTNLPTFSDCYHTVVVKFFSEFP